MKLSPRQLEVLRYFGSESEKYAHVCDNPTDHPLAEHNYERVVEALRARLLVDDNGITEYGRAVLAHMHPPTRSILVDTNLWFLRRP